MESARDFVPQSIDEGVLEYGCVFTLSTHEKLPRAPCSQNHRMVEVERNLWRSSCATPLPKQDHQEQVVHDRVQMAFDHLQGWWHHNLSGEPVPVLSHSHSKNEFPDVQMRPPVFQFVPSVSGPITGHHWRKPSSILFAPLSNIH